MEIKRSLSLGLSAIVLLATAAWCQDSPIQQQTRKFLDAWARGDQQAVMSLIDPVAVTVYGSDESEVAHGADAVLKMLALDQQLWGGAAHIGKMEHVTVVQDDDLASIFFDAAFSVGDRGPTPVRFAATWKREGGKWLLVQSSNVAPTQHQSATELLHPAQSH